MSSELALPLKPASAAPAYLTCLSVSCGGFFVGCLHLLMVSSGIAIAVTVWRFLVKDDKTGPHQVRLPLTTVLQTVRRRIPARTLVIRIGRSSCWSLSLRCGFSLGGLDGRGGHLQQILHDWRQLLHEIATISRRTCSFRNH